MCRLTITCLAIYLVTAWQRANAAPIDEQQLAIQRERQQQVQADTDALVRRLGTMLRVLDYYQIDKGGERKLIDEMAGILSGLSRRQMNEVMRRLENAAQASDPTKAAGEVDVAYDRHREILDSLKSLLVRHEAVRSLGQAAELLEKLAKDQLELHLSTGQLIKDSVDQGNANLPVARRALIDKRRGAGLEPRRQADVQGEIHQDTIRVIDQVSQLRGSLPAEQKGRVDTMRQLADKCRVIENLREAADKLKTNGSPVQQLGVWQAVNGTQWQAAGQLHELARALRTAAERLTALREARERIDAALVKQHDLHQETKDNAKSLEKAPAPGDPKAALAKAAQEIAAAEKTQELTTRQARIESEIKDTANLIKPHVAAIAGHIEEAERAMDKVRGELTKGQPAQAATPQEQAAKKLEIARDDLAKLIAAADKEAGDPAMALKRAAADLDNLIKDQTATRAQTKNAQDAARLAALAKDQKRLATRAQQLKDTPLPITAEGKALLSDAAQEMAGAGKALDKVQAVSAVSQQDQALQALRSAKKEMGAKLAELARRQDELAKLQKAATKPGEVANAEQLADIHGKNLADQAALQPNQIDPEATAQLLAKALEQTENAEHRASEAAQLARREKPNVSNVPERHNAKGGAGFGYVAGEHRQSG